MNNNSNWPMQCESDTQDPDQGVISQSLDLDFQGMLKLQMNKCSVQKRVEQQQERVSEIVSKISQLLDFAPIDISAAYYLLLQLQSQLRMEESAQIKTEFLQIIVLEFRDKMVSNYEIQKIVQYQLLIYEADTILRKIDSKHVSIDNLEEIMISLTQKAVPMSRDFLIENAIATDLWFQAIKMQGFQLAYDEELMKLITQFIDYPFAFKVFIGQKNIPFNQDICNKAWERMKEIEVSSFMIDEMYRGEQYFEEFLKFGIYDAFKVFINETLNVHNGKVRLIKIILHCLSVVWSDNALFCDTEYIYQSRIFDHIANIPIEVFSKESLQIVLQFVERIDSNSKYDLNFIIQNFTWYQRLNKVLLYQKFDKKIAENAILRIEQLCIASLSQKAGKSMKAIITEYQEPSAQKSIYQKFLNLFL